MARPRSQPEFDFSQVAGHYTVLCFAGQAPDIAAMAAAVQARWDLFNGDFASLFLIAADPADARLAPLRDTAGLHVLGDEDGGLARLYGVSHADGGTSFVLDPMLRVVGVIPVRDAASHTRDLIETVAAQPRPGRRPAAPVLVLPRVFEPDLCLELIRLFQRAKTRDTGFMSTDSATGHTMVINDYGVKRRRDCIIEDENLQRAVLERLSRRLVPEIRKAFQFEVTRVERCIVACYESRDRGHFRIHRDNSSKATAHRRFAVTINLNAGGYDGGELVFPEFGTELWSPPTGAALTFSCSLLHEVRPVTRGARYCFLPFLFDEAAEEMRLRNHASSGAAADPH